MRKKVIDLRTQDGNAYVLLGLASSWAKQMEREVGWNSKAIMGELIEADDYNQLLDVFEKHFGVFSRFENDPREEFNNNQAQGGAHDEK
jgi:hypothetical protein